MNQEVELKVVNSQIRDHLPRYSTPGAAGLDLRACISEPLILRAGESALVSTGFAIYLRDRDLAAMILPRSGLGHRHGLVLGNLVGLIDSDYQGEIKVSLWNRSDQDYTIKPLERVAQLVIVPIKQVKFRLVEEFQEVEKRADSGFGSTGCW
ncbi:MAG: dUTP diphosphatase [Neisseriaceae bacterium]